MSTFLNSRTTPYTEQRLKRSQGSDPIIFQSEFPRLKTARLSTVYSLSVKKLTRSMSILGYHVQTHRDNTAESRSISPVLLRLVMQPPVKYNQRPTGR